MGKEIRKGFVGLSGGGERVFFLYVCVQERG